MNVGDLVKIKLGRGVRLNLKSEPVYSVPYHGIILDAMERDTGFFEYQVFCNGDVEWFCDLELEVISESR